MNDRNEIVARIDLAPIGGIAGDMFAAALFSAFPSLYEGFCADLESLRVQGLSATLEDRLSCGLLAKYFNVVQHTTDKPPRTLSAVKKFLTNSAIDETVAMHAIEIFTLLANAEAEVHGKTIDTIHFHEVSDWDSVVDIVAASGIIARLDCKTWRVGELPLGAGTVNTAHGDIPIPAPATVALLKGFQWQDDGIAGERVTPTGAAILAYLKAAPSGNTTDAARLLVSGSGCGSRELVGRANILRATAFIEASSDEKISPAERCDVLHDEVVRLAFEIDDMTAEEIAWASNRIRQLSGVLDVACLSMLGKKDRHTIGIRILVTPSQFDTVTQSCFALTTTLGIRHVPVQRLILPRTEEKQAGVNVKVVARPNGQMAAKASSDDINEACSLQERRQQAQAGCNEALSGRLITDD